MPRTVAKDSGEKLQIAILTFAMTGGGFALLTLLLIFLNRGAAEDANRMEKSYKDLTATLLDAEMRQLRANAPRGEPATDNSLGEIVKAALDRNGLKCSNFPQVKPKPGKKAGLEELPLRITVDPAKLQPLLMFVAEVQEAKKTINVESVDFKRDNRSKPEEELWTATVDFIEYVTK